LKTETNLLKAFGPLVVILTASVTSVVRGQEPPTDPPHRVSIDIPSQPVADALTTLGKQTGLTIIIDFAVGSGVVTRSIVGDFTPDEALKKLLAPTGLKAEYLDAKIVAVRLGGKKAGRLPAPAGGNTAPQKSSTGPQ